MLERTPLLWPAGWKRTAPVDRKNAKFLERGEWNHLTGISVMREPTFAGAAKRVAKQLSFLGVNLRSHESCIISSNRSRSGNAEQDPGVALYWTPNRGPQRTIAIDRYTRAADNLAAIAATFDAMRAIDRHGGAMILERVFTGFDALAAPDAFDPWAVLGIWPPATRDQIMTVYRNLARLRHPDQGGSTDAMSLLNRARDRALELTS